MNPMLGWRTNTQITKIWDNLFLGTLWNAEQLVNSNPYSITSMVNCTEERIAFHPNGIDRPDSIQLDHQDGYPFPFDKIFYACEWIHRKITKGPVLICCHAGCSRSPGITLAYLMSCGMGYKEALFLIESLRRQVQIANAIDLSVRQAFGIAPRSSQDLIGG